MTTRCDTCGARQRNSFRPVSQEEHEIHELNEKSTECGRWTAKAVYAQAAECFCLKNPALCSTCTNKHKWLVYKSASENYPERRHFLSIGDWVAYGIGSVVYAVKSCCGNPNDYID